MARRRHSSVGLYHKTTEKHRIQEKTDREEKGGSVRAKARQREGERERERESEREMD